MDFGYFIWLLRLDIPHTPVGDINLKDLAGVMTEGRVTNSHTEVTIHEIRIMTPPLKDTQPAVPRNLEAISHNGSYHIALPSLIGSLTIY